MGMVFIQARRGGRDSIVTGAAVFLGILAADDGERFQLNEHTLLRLGILLSVGILLPVLAGMAGSLFLPEEESENRFQSPVARKRERSSRVFLGVILLALTLGLSYLVNQLTLSALVFGAGCAFAGLFAAQIPILASLAYAFFVWFGVLYGFLWTGDYETRLPAAELAPLTFGILSAAFSLDWRSLHREAFWRGLLFTLLNAAIALALTPWAAHRPSYLAGWIAVSSLSLVMALAGKRGASRHLYQLGGLQILLFASLIWPPALLAGIPVILAEELLQLTFRLAVKEKKIN